jgi:hypothetical protein
MALRALIIVPTGSGLDGMQVTGAVIAMEGKRDRPDSVMYASLVARSSRWA